MPYAIVFQLGDCFYQTGNWDLAGRVYTELLAVYPESEDRALFQWRQAQCLARTGQVEQARAALEELRTEQPGTVWARLSAETLSDIDWLEDYPDLFSEGGVL
jgi:TolA-binding protein